MYKSRIVDDKIVILLGDYDKKINNIVNKIKRNHPGFVLYFLLHTFDSLGAGGVKFLNHRKKVDIKKEIVNVMLTNANLNKLERSHKISLLRMFIEHAAKYQQFSYLYGEPNLLSEVQFTLAEIDKMIKIILKATYQYLSKIVLTKYASYEGTRTINSALSYTVFMDDVQNSYFGIMRAIGLFLVGKHKSFFSYATRWIKEGLSSCDFSMEYVNDISIDSLDENELIDVKEIENDTIIFKFPEIPAPIPPELRILSYII